MKVFLVLAMVMLSTMLAVNAFAAPANYAYQTVTFEIAQISQLSVSGNPDALVIYLLDEYGDLVPAVDYSTTYDIYTNGTSQRITGEIDESMPSYTTLGIALETPSTGSSLGWVSLSTSPQNLVTGISTLSGTELEIGYEFSATIQAGRISEDYLVVTLTIADAI
jgi:hypothetical protein